MAEQIFPHALTTLARVKDRLALDLTKTTQDAVLIRLINAVTDYIESDCNIRFKQTLYTDQLYSVWPENKLVDYVALKHAPVVNVASVSFRSGLPSTPNWIAMNTDQFYLLESGKSGLMRLFAGVVGGPNMLKITYTAGYLIDFTNYGDITKHSLPADLTDLAERLVVRWFKRREHEGKERETAAGDTVIWAKDLTVEDKDTLAGYVRVPTLV